MYAHNVYMDAQHLAARNGNALLVKALVALGANELAHDAFGRTSLHEAAF